MKGKERNVLSFKRTDIRLTLGEQDSSVWLITWQNSRTFKFMIVKRIVCLLWRKVWKCVNRWCCFGQGLYGFN